MEKLVQVTIESAAMSEEHLMEDVSEAEDSGFLDVYIRFNDDLEKDYCFQIKLSDRFENLFKIFDTLPIALRPSIFHRARPIGFRVSTAPGYLTEDGGFLFDYAASKFYKNVLLSDKISANIWSGQLILPVWEFNTFAFYLFLTFLLVWLYTDLPSFVSPTPGICLTNQLTKGASYAATYFGYPAIAVSLLKEIEDPGSITAQCLFFGLHLFKSLVIFVIFYGGFFNPIKLWRFGSSKIKLNITRDELIELGWTGSRKATPDEYKEYYRDYKIKEYGGMIKAHQAGLFDTLRDLGVFLKMGEGFSTPIDHKSTLKDLEESTKFTMNYEYIGLLGQYFTIYIQDKEGKELSDLIKQYRRYGLLHSNEKIQSIVQHRKALEPKTSE